MQGNLVRTDRRLIEAGFPCHQVGAETQRERDTGKAPPTHRLHVWWARRPLTPSRAAILGSLVPADADPEWFLRQLGIEKVQAMVNGEPWTINDDMQEKVKENESGSLYLYVDETVKRELQKEQRFRQEQRELLKSLIDKNPTWRERESIKKWELLCKPLPEPLPQVGEMLSVHKVAADPAWFNDLMELVSSAGVRIPNLYGYSRAYIRQPELQSGEITVLDPTAGGGSIPFEALRLGYRVIANDLNPVATTILYATLDYPIRFGVKLLDDIERYGNKLLTALEQKISDVFPSVFPLPLEERKELEKHLHAHLHLIPQYDYENTTTYLYARQVTCPHCGGEAPLLNTCWLSKEGDKWGVRIVPDGRERGGTVRFETYRVKGNRGPNGEDPNFATVTDGVGLCVHCRQAISADEIKAQARGESPHGKWKDRLYCVVAVRYQPKLDKNGQPQRYKSGEKAGEIKTEKIRFFRPPNERDLAALEEAERRLQQHWPEWEKQGLIPTEQIPEGYNTKQPLSFGMVRWCDMFNPRQLLGHLILIEELNRIKPIIINELGFERGRAVVTYLQFMIDKGLDYNSKQTRWIPQRAIVSGTFGRHDYSPKWTYGEIIFSGSNSCAAWGLSQIIDAYSEICELVKPVKEKYGSNYQHISILNGTAANMALNDKSVDLICIDPPYYNNVQYAEMSDYFYVWQRRTLNDLYPDIYWRKLTNKQDEAVANPIRHGSIKDAERVYERLMSEIFIECHRILKDDGLMTIMFTHKTQEAWEALTRSLIENGWTITSSFPVESEFAKSMRINGYAAATSSIFLSCRKRPDRSTSPAVWSGFGGTGVVQKVREAVREGLKEFETLNLNPVDEMVASYGRALQVLSENWPVLDGDELVSPVRAMHEASAVVAQYQVARITNGRLKVDDLKAEAAVALTLFGIFGLSEFAYDEALSLSRSLNVRLEMKAGGYQVNGPVIGINTETQGRRAGNRDAEEVGYHAPLLRRGSKLRLARPEERSPQRLEHPQTEWDLLHGLIMKYREGDIPVARAYLAQHAGGKAQVVLDLLSVWAAENADGELRKEAEQMLYGLKG